VSYNGIEIDMVSLGDADSLLVTEWSDDKPCRILIDGGNFGDTPKVTAHLKEWNVTKLEHVICSHSDRDHAGGLIDFVDNADFEIGTFWMHLPWNHVNVAETKACLKKFAMKTAMASLDTARTLYEAAIRRGLDLKEPFTGAKIGFLEVLGPDEGFYAEKLEDYRDVEKLAAMSRNKYAEAFNLDSVKIIGPARNSKYVEANSKPIKLGQPPTDSENETSTILRAMFDGKALIFTGDAGVQALSRVKAAFPDVAGCKWIQVPHHGSSRNVTDELIAFFASEVAFISAVGNKQHPRQEVVDAFKVGGTTVFSTHYPFPGALYQPLGNVPKRGGCFIEAL